MLKLKQCAIVLTLTLISLGLVSVQTFAEEDFSKPDELVLKSEAVFKSFKADVLLYPKINLVEASVSKNKAHWDGVSEYVGTAGAIGLSFYRTWKGRITALTLVVEVQDIDRETYFKTPPI